MKSEWMFSGFDDGSYMVTNSNMGIVASIRLETKKDYPDIPSVESCWSVRWWNSQKIICNFGSNLTIERVVEKAQSFIARELIKLATDAL